MNSVVTITHSPQYSVRHYAGASAWVDDICGSGATMIFADPHALPELWHEYIDSAVVEYTARGVRSALEYERIRDGRDTTVFCAVLDPTGAVVGGLRVQGPYHDARQSHAIGEWAGQPGQDDLIAAINHRVPDGIIEVKSAFVDPSSPLAKVAAGALARSVKISMELTGCRHMLATAADYVLERWSSGGGRVNPLIAATPYPDDRYRTRAMFWDAENLQSFADPDVWEVMNAEYTAAFRSREVSAGTATVA
jgi:hypothetical protein